MCKYLNNSTRVKVFSYILSVTVFLNSLYLSNSFFSFIICLISLSFSTADFFFYPFFLKPSLSLSIHTKRKTGTFISHVYLNFNSNTRQSEHLRSICTRISGGCRKVLRFHMISGSGVQEFCCYDKLHGNAFHHQQLVAEVEGRGGGGFGLDVKMGLVKSSKSVRGMCV